MNGGAKAIADAIWYEKYHWQGFLYNHIRQLAHEGDNPHVMVFVCNESPHEVRIVRIKRSGMEGQRLYWKIAETEVGGPGGD